MKDSDFSPTVFTIHFMSEGIGLWIRFLQSLSCRNAPREEVAFIGHLPEHKRERETKSTRVKKEI